GRLVTAATTVMESIVSRYPPTHVHSYWTTYLEGVSTYDADQVLSLRVPRGPAELVERRVSLATDMRVPIPLDLGREVLEKARRDHVPILEGQVRRALAAAALDAEEMTRAVEMFERLGAVPQLGRARAERGLLTHDPAETEAGLAILKRLGDVNYLD